ncbi:MAG: guanine deaminase [Burkholderiales bacterium]|nr:guanine deaminase [Burkholderiales bacterium]
MSTLYRGKIFTFTNKANLQNLQGTIPNALFVDDDKFKFIRDGGIIVDNGKITAVGEYEELKSEITDQVKIVDYSSKLITPGFIDSHMHATQTSGVGAYGEKLLAWLDNYIFPSEVAFNSEQSGRREYEILLKELFKNGTTSICAYLPTSYDGADLLFEITDKFKMRAVMGNTIMTHGNPQLITDPQTSMKISEKLYNKWHNTNRISYALTPRFALSCTEETLGLCKEFIQSHSDAYAQTHVCENVNEIADTLLQFPWAKDYLSVYEKYGLVHEKAIYGHCIHLSDSEWQRMVEKKAIFANCPTSNNYLGSGLFKYHKAIEMNAKLTFASDWAAGNSLSMFRVMDDAYKVSMLNSFKLETLTRWFSATLGTAQALGLDKYIGSLEVGKEADFIVLDPQRNPLLNYRLESIFNLLDYLFSYTTMGDDRVVAATYIYGNKVHGL